MTVRLIDGREVDSTSAEHRDECLARHVLALPTLADRREWLAQFEKRHGRATADGLRETMRAVHEARVPQHGVASADAKVEA